jgi:hypothetical protein
VFSEPVRGASTSTLRLRNLTTGRWVNVKVTYSPSTHSAIIDPILWMFRGERYAVYVLAGIRDTYGNALLATHWSFKTSP